MWQKIANGILRNRLAILLMLGVITTFMGYKATQVELLYEFGALLPKDDSTNVDYLQFRERYGQDGLVVVVSTEIEDFYTVDKFNKWNELGNKIKDMKVPIKGSSPVQYVHPVDSVFSEALLYNIVKDKENKKFTLQPLVTELPTTQAEVDSLRDVVRSLPFYENIIYKDSSNMHLMMIFVNEGVFNSKSRGNLVADIQKLCGEYGDDFGDLKFSGLPYVRSVTMSKVSGELGLFVALAALMVSIVLFIFYRSVKVVLTSLLVVVIGVIWSLGTISLLDYKISALMGLIPPLMIVIGIPNCVYLITKYQQEYLLHKNKARSLVKVIRKVGNATFLTNATTAMGFGTFLLTSSDMMREFGLVAFINILALFLISILIVPIVYSYLNGPKEKHTKHLDKKWLDKAMESLVIITTSYRKWVYIISVGVIIAGLFGMTLMKTSGNIVDDLPKNDAVVKDLKYFEKELNGVMPFELLIRAKDTIYMNGKLPNYRNLKAIDDIQFLLSSEDKLSKSVSLVNAIKYISQVYSGGDKSDYTLKSPESLISMMGSDYFKNTFAPKGSENSDQFLGSFLDSTHRETRVTIQMKDVGIDSMEAVLTRVKSKIESVVGAEERMLDSILKNQVNVEEGLLVFYEAYPWILSAMEDSLVAKGKVEDEFAFIMDEELIKTFHKDKNYQKMLSDVVKQEKLSYIITGSGVIFTRGTTYLVGNLFTSLLAAVVVIGVLMAFLFRSWRMVLVSLIPNILPLVFTSGLMGYMGVPIKPSTILVFSIAFGISVDDTIHFLAKYRQELKVQSWNIRGSVLNAIKETGVSMIYTSIILFFGFSIFIASSFGGTQALGILVSVTLLVAMLSNLILLPSLLLSLERFVTTKAFRDPFLEVVDEDEDIELDKLKIEDKFEKN